MKKFINWENIKIEYETGKYPNTAIADKYGITESAIRKKAKAEEWEKPLKDKTSAKRRKKSHLNGDIAKEKFEDIKEELGTQMSSLDNPLLVALCNQYERYVNLEKRVINEGEVIISPRTGASYLNPTYNALQSSLKTLATLSKEFGLTVASRKRVGVEIANKDDEKDSIFNIMSKINHFEEIEI